jgi:hypothetical protein
VKQINQCPLNFSGVNPMSKQPKQVRFIFHEISDLKSAQAVGRQGAAMCALITTLLTLGVFFQSTGGNLPWMVISLLVYGTSAVMIYRMSRAASVVACILYLASSLGAIVQNGLSPVGILIQALVAIAFINSVRGTFAYHRFRHQRQEAMQEEPEAVS